MPTWRRAGREPGVTPELAAGVAGLDRASLGTANAEGQPSIQYRAGPPDCLKALDGQPLGFADFGGNRQDLTVGHLSENPKAFRFLIDDAYRRRRRPSCPSWSNGEDRCHGPT